MSRVEGGARVLLVEDDASFRRTLTEVLRAHGYEVTASSDAVCALEALRTEEIDVVVTDLVMPGMKGPQLLESIRESFPAVPVIAVTAFGSIEGALDLTRAGAADYLAKPFRTRALLEALERALLESRPFRDEAKARRGIGEHVEGIVGASPPMLELFDRMARVARSQAPVLITGETGTGKELVARGLHRASGRDPFIPLNCGALPEHLIESELFGHAEGAFTGAAREKVGLMEAADGGTILLDEIAELPLALQPKLLRALESSTIRRLGEVEEREVHVRVMAATHRDLATVVEEGGFREDLYWRLNVLHLHVPPLRDRRADIPLLVEALLARAGPAGRSRTLSPEALSVLGAHPWPGNVRQLRNVLERALAFSDGATIEIEDLPADVQETGGTTAFIEATADREATLADVERAYVLEILRRAGGNKTRAAEILGIPRRTLYRRLEEYGADEGVVTPEA